MTGGGGSGLVLPSALDKGKGRGRGKGLLLDGRDGASPPCPLLPPSAPPRLLPSASGVSASHEGPIRVRGQAAVMEGDVATLLVTPSGRGRGRVSVAASAPVPGPAPVGRANALLTASSKAGIDGAAGTGRGRGRGGGGCVGSGANMRVGLSAAMAMEPRTSTGKFTGQESAGGVKRRRGAGGSAAGPAGGGRGDGGGRWKGNVPLKGMPAAGAARGDGDNSSEASGSESASHMRRSGKAVRKGVEDGGGDCNEEQRDQRDVGKDDDMSDGDAGSLDLGDDDLVKSASDLTREEVVRRRAKRLRKLLSLYEAQYWAWMEELRAKHRRFYLRTGKSGWKADVASGDVDGEGLRKSGGRGEQCGGGEDAANLQCAAQGCSSNPLALTSYCLSHILLDQRQKLYKPCTFVLRNGASGPSVCGRPVLCALVPPLCTPHGLQTQKQAARVQKKTVAAPASTTVPALCALMLPTSALATAVAPPPSPSSPPPVSTQPTDSVAMPAAASAGSRLTNNTVAAPAAPPLASTTEAMVTTATTMTTKSTVTMATRTAAVGVGSGHGFESSMIHPMPRLHLVINEYVRIIQNKRRVGFVADVAMAAGHPQCARSLIPGMSWA